MGDVLCSKGCIAPDLYFPKSLVIYTVTYLFSISVVFIIAIAWGLRHWSEGLFYRRACAVVFSLWNVHV